MIRSKDDYRTPEFCRAAALALEGVMHEMVCIADAELLAKRADQWCADAEAAKAVSRV